MLRWIALMLVTSLAFVTCVVPSARAANADRLAYLDQGQLFVMDGEGRSVRELAPLHASDLSGAAWSPDGRSIAYLSSVTWFGEGLVYRRQIRTIRADGSGDRSVFTLRLCCDTSPIGVAGQFVSAPTWSPDGSRIAFFVTTIVCAGIGACGAASSLMTVRDDGSQPKTVAADVYTTSEPAWSPDGLRIAYTSGAFATSILNVRADGTGVPTRVSPLGLNAWAPAWSRDNRVAFVGTALNVLSRHGGAIWVARPDGSGATRLPVVSSDAPSWSPDGRRLAISTEDGIHSVRADGRDSRRITTAAAGYAHRWPRWTLSGSHIAYIAMGIEWDARASLWSVGADRRTPPRQLAGFNWYEPTYSWAPR
jgi:Tol biopolymer transport system component